jgi:nitrogen fixation protein FixH
MKISWGTKLTIVFILFAGSISYMVYRCSNVPVDLVTSEYYKEELVYQDIIDGTKNANALSTAVSLQKSGDDVVIKLPEEMKNTLVKGTVFFYCPSQAGHDRKIDLQTGNDAMQVIQANKLAPGSYKVKIDWQAGNKHYYSEQAFKI